MSRQKTSTVVLNVEALSARKAWLALSIVNNNQADSITIFDTDIRAQADDAQLEIIFSDGIVKAEKRSQFWKEALAGLVAGANAYYAGQSGRYTETGTVSGHADTYGNRTYFDATYRASGVDPTAQQMAIDRANETNEHLFMSIEDENAGRMQALASEILYSQIIPAGQGYAGRVQISLPRKKRGESTAIDITVPLRGGESHRFLVFADGPPRSDYTSRFVAQLELSATDKGATSSSGTSAPRVDVPQPNSAVVYAPEEKIERLEIAYLAAPTTATSTPNEVESPDSTGPSDPADFPENPAKEEVKVDRPSLVGVSKQLTEPNISPSTNVASASSDSVVLKINPAVDYEIQPTILNIELDGENIFFDVHWKVVGRVGATSGKLQLMDQSGAARISMPWAISEVDAKRGDFVESGVGFPSSAFRHEAKWLSEVQTETLNARFKIDED